MQDAFECVDIERWVVSIVDAPAPRETILCIPWAGAGPEAFMPWRAAAADDLSLSALRLPGRSTRFRESFMTSVDAIVSSALPSLLCRFNDRPLTIFGHSFGALLAFELCRLLERAGAAPKRLVVSGSSAPSAIAANTTKVAHLPADSFLAKVAEYGGLPPEMASDGALRRLFTPILRADFAVLESYVSIEPARVSTPLLVMSGRGDPAVTPFGFAAWHAATDSTCEFRVFEGGHFYFRGIERAVLACIAG